MTEASPPTCPPEIHKCLSEILYYSLVQMRSKSQDSRYCYLMADHLHNIPHLLDRFSPGKLFYYWEVERPSFQIGMKRENLNIPSSILEQWKLLKRPYLKLRAEHHDLPAIVIDPRSGMIEVARDVETIERYIAQGRFFRRVRVIDSRRVKRVFYTNLRGERACISMHADPEEIRRTLLNLGRAITGFDPRPLREAKYVGDMFDAYLAQEKG